jgi:hypothetical protein
MPTTKKRINITISPHIDEILSALSKRDGVPVATKTAELLKLAIEIDEDDILNTLAIKRDTKNAQFISHNETWA